jgi:hypothetical protein
MRLQAASILSLAVVAYAEPNPPAWPASVQVIAPGDSDCDSKCAAAFATNGGHVPSNHGQFSTERFAFLFKPGTHDCDCPIGYYTQAMGLGKTPSDVTFTSPRGVYSEEGDYSIGGALSSFWRSAENFKTEASNKWGTGTGMMWAVSQAAPLRRVEVANDLVLFEYEPPIPAAGEASGGYFANLKVGGSVNLGSQQQWYARDSTVGKWVGGVWNVVTTGVVGGPPTHCGDKGGTPATAVPATPLISEKPFLTIDAAGKFNLMVPKLKTASSGADHSGAGDTAVPFEKVRLLPHAATARKCGRREVEEGPRGGSPSLQPQACRWKVEHPGSFQHDKTVAASNTTRTNR